MGSSLFPDPAPFFHLSHTYHIMVIFDQVRISHFQSFTHVQYAPLLFAHPNVGHIIIYFLQWASPTVINPYRTVVTNS